MSTTITTAQGLQDINNGPSGSYVLGNDIDMTGFSFTPIGLTAPFNGSFDGAGFTISNLSVTDTGSYASCALFAQTTTTASIADVTLEDFVLVGNNYVGALIGYCNGSDVTGINASGIGMRQYVGTSDILHIGCLIGKANNTTYLNDCEVSGTMSYSSSANSATISDIGGLVGKFVSGSFSNCYMMNISMVVSAAGTGGLLTNIGGLFGSFYGNSLQRCYSDGRITITSTASDSGTFGVGGFGGGLSVAASPYLRDCYSRVDIEANCFNCIGFSGFIGNFSGSAGS